MEGCFVFKLCRPSCYQCKQVFCSYKQKQTVCIKLKGKVTFILGFYSFINVKPKLKTSILWLFLGWDTCVCETHVNEDCNKRAGGENLILLLGALASSCAKPIGMLLVKIQKLSKTKGLSSVKSLCGDRQQ